MNILGIDFEEWFHPELIQRFLTNEKRTFEITKGIDAILNLLDKHDTYATFFVVGEILKNSPELLDKILENGHEIGFHTMNHTRLDSPNFSKKFPNELDEFSKLTNNKSKGFRAPTFSLNEKSSWAIDILEKYGYLYDSSIVPAKSSMYGNPGAPRSPYAISSRSLITESSNGKIIEFPLMVTKFLGKTIPIGGGFYLRTLPFKVTKNALKDYEKQNNPGIFYIHSWELTPENMPRLKLSTKDQFITYHNLEKVPSRIEELLSSFDFTSFEKFINSK